MQRHLASTRFLAVVALAFGLGPVPGLPAQETPVGVLETVSLPPPLDAVLRGYEDAWRARDAAGLAALFAEDGFILRPGRPPVRGRDAIRVAYEGSGGPLHLIAYDYATADSVGYIIGGYGASEGLDQVVGKFVLALRRASSGTWLIVADMDNGNF